MEKNMQGKIKELDREERNNHRRHRAHRDDIDVTIVDREPEENKRYPRAKILSLSRQEDWLEIIFSKRHEDLRQLVEDERISAAIQELTDRQKQVLHLNIVKQYTPQDIAGILQTTDRNVRKHREKALEAIRRALGDRRGEGYVDTVMVILGWMLLPTFMFGWEVSKRVYPHLKQALLEKAA